MGEEFDYYKTRADFVVLTIEAGKKRICYAQEPEEN